MKKLALILIIVSALFFSTSCQTIDRAIEDTFKPATERKTPQDEEESQFKKLADTFIDESNTPVSPIDILDDAQDKAGFEFSMTLESYFRNYIRENEIESYLTEEEVMDILEKRNAENFLLNPGLARELIDQLFKDKGWEGLEVEAERMQIYEDSIYMYIIDPNNKDLVDLYYYNQSLGDWHITPDKNPALRTEETISMNDFPIENIGKIMAASKEVLEEMGDYNEYDWTSISSLGVTAVHVRIYQGELVFNVVVRGTRQDYNLVFDQDGNLIDKGVK